MDVTFRIGRNIIIDNMTDPLHVQSPCRHIGRNENIVHPVFKPADRFLTLALRHIAVQGRGSIPSCLKLLGEFQRRCLSTHENNHAIKVFDFENTGKCIELMLTGNRKKALRSSIYRRAFRLEDDFGKIAHILPGNSAYRRRHCRREQRNLARCRSPVENPLDIIDKSHPEHLVSFVKHKSADTFKVKRFPFYMVDHPSRGTDDNMHTTFQTTKLAAVILTSVDRKHMEIFQKCRVTLKGF